jgi:hypothetical protein
MRFATLTGIVVLLAANTWSVAEQSRPNILFILTVPL